MDDLSGDCCTIREVKRIFSESGVYGEGIYNKNLRPLEVYMTIKSLQYLLQKLEWLSEPG
jgi:hypothetical protein